MAYRADIEIAVRGAQELKQLQNQIRITGDAVTSLNSSLNAVANLLPRSFNNLNKLVGEAAEKFNEVALGTQEATAAARAYVRATDELNAGLRERIQLLQDVTEGERKARLAAIGREVGGRPAGNYGGPIGPGAASPIGSLVGQKSPVAENIRRNIQARKDETDLQQALLRLEEKSADIANKKVQAQEALVKGTQEVLELVAAQARKSEFLAGASGALAQGPLAGVGAMGFPVALPLTKVEQKSLEINAKKQEILNRMAATRQQLSGLAANLQRLDQNSAVAIADANRNQKQLNRSKQESVELAERELNISKQGTLLAGKFSPIAGAANIPGSPLFLQAQQQRRASQLSGIALGGGFPLLFGGGPGAVLGGAAGGLVPGPNAFAAQIGLSAIGQQADMFVAAAAKTGIALTSTGKMLEFMREKALFSTTAVEDQSYALEEQGRVSELAKLLTQDLARSIGGEGVRALQELGDQTNKLTQEWNLLTAQLFALVAGPLRAFIAALNSVLGGITTENRLSILRREATPAQQARLAQITREERGGETRNVRGGGRQFIAGAETTQVRQNILNRAAAEGIVPAAPPGRVTSADVRGMPVPKTSDKSARDAAREAARVLEVLRDQRLITIELERQSEYSRKIFAAELAKDPILVRRLQGEQELEEIAIEAAGKLEKELNMEAKLAILKAQEAKAALAYQKTAQAIALIEQQRKENTQNTIASLEYEVKLKNAVTEAERNRLRIEYEMVQLAKDPNISKDRLAEIEALKKQLAAPQSSTEIIQQRIGTLSDELTKLLNVGTQVTQIAETIGTSFAESFKGVISGAMTAQEALSSFFQSVADRFLDMAAQIIAKWIEMTILNSVVSLFPGGGGMGLGGAVSAAGKLSPSIGFGAGTFTGFGARANGGPVSAGSPYMVGKRGPELFVPGRSGTIVPNNALSAGGATNVVVNVDANGSSVQGNESQAGQLGKVIGLAVQQELIKQKRPGGLLA